MKTRPIVGVDLKKIHRLKPFGGYKAAMVVSQRGGYVPYTDYCINVSRLKDKVQELEIRLFNLKKFGKSRVMKLRQR